MSISFKPTTIALPDSGSFFSRSPSCSPSVKFQKDPFDKLSTDFTSPPPNTSSSNPYPKTPYPQAEGTSNPLEDPNLTGLISSNTFTRDLSDISCSSLSELLKPDPTSNNFTVLIIDLRPTIHFAKCHIVNSLSICVPSTLLRRPTYDLNKVLSSVSDESHHAVLVRWAEFKNIVFVDANSVTLKEDSPIYHLFHKFPCRDLETSFFWLKGGFKAFQTSHSEQIFTNKGPLLGSSTSKNTQSTFLGPLTCPISSLDNSPRSSQFFDSLRQYNTASNVLSETIPIQMPNQACVFSNSPSPAMLPLFLQIMVEKNVGEKTMAEAFQKLDLSEQARLRAIASTASNSSLQSPYNVSAGIEKGHKNRYLNIWPYEHTRIKLEEYSPGDSDYINASLIHESITNNRYIATQGPLPSTFQDFWQVIWQYNTRLIVMLTKEEEGGRVRCHRYWPDELGQTLKAGDQFEVKLIQQATCSRTGLLTLRKFVLSRCDNLGEPRSIVQLQFSGWPDFGVPDEPSILLRVRNLARSLQNAFESRVPGAGPMVVHCSAGCGRTGAFCTIDSAIAALDSGKASCYPDVVYSIVDSFRDQRLSMVQTHRQLVLCYESLIWYLLSDRRCGDLSGLCPNLRRVDISTPDPSTPFFDACEDSYFTPAAFTGNVDSYFSLPSNSTSAIPPKTDGFPFF